MTARHFQRVFARNQPLQQIQTLTCQVLSRFVESFAPVQNLPAQRLQAHLLLRGFCRFHTLQEQLEEVVIHQRHPHLYQQIHRFFISCCHQRLQESLRGRVVGKSTHNIRTVGESLSHRMGLDQVQVQLPETLHFSAHR
ncbi:MAG: hypothetical protein BWY63_03757 [Chloroflexi bacterium ADurb.Bin360]|nr:MAG: hypothetical protein BWY63_03757 [Chloroflexi bacterium ADurb.Bin360]